MFAKNGKFSVSLYFIIIVFEWPAHFYFNAPNTLNNKFKYHNGPNNLFIFFGRTVFYVFPPGSVYSVHKCTGCFRFHVIIFKVEKKCYYINNIHDCLEFIHFKGWRENNFRNLQRNLLLLPVNRVEPFFIII